MDDRIKSSPLFSVVFEDGSLFVGGTSYFESKWLEIPNKKIKRIFYRLPNNDYICLGGYEKYFHMIEATQDLTGPLKGKVKLHYAYIMGKLKDKVISYRITLFNNENDKYRIGDITMRIFDINNEKIKKLNSSNWR